MSWKLDRLGRDLRHLVNLVDELTRRGIGLRVLAGEGANIDTTTANGRLVFGNFAALAEFELAYRRAHSGRPLKMTSVKLRLTQAAMGQPETKVGELCALPGRPSTVTSIPRARPTGWAEVA